MTRAAEGPGAPAPDPTNEMPATKRQPLAADGIPAGRQVPLFRSPEWHALPNTDPRKSAAVWRAADAWVEYWSKEEVTRRLAEELEFLDREVIRRIRAASYEVCTGMDWRALASQPTHAELERRRGEVPDRVRGAA